MSSDRKTLWGLDLCSCNSFQQKTPKTLSRV
jgi:hypothetical protein